MSRGDSRLRIVVTGLIAQHPRLGGVAWDYLQYPAALAAMGHDVHYLEDSGEWPYRLEGDGPDGWVARDPSDNVRHLRSTMERFGLGDRWMYRFAVDGRWFGLREARRREVLSDADLVINVSGSLEHPERYGGGPRLVYLDSDPVFTQARIRAEPRGDLARRVDAHDAHFSFGARIADSDAAARHRWRSTRQPVMIDAWRPVPDVREVLTTVMNWASYPPEQLGSVRLGQKDAELRRLLHLPALSPVPLEIALGSVRHEGWESASGDLPDAARASVRADPGLSPAQLLERAGWGVVDAIDRCGTLDDYRSYISSSWGEWSVAKSGYVTGRSGWFSCRSACYLAAGRPVIVQDTGFAPYPPAGRGVLTFHDHDTALAAIEALRADHARHAVAAREVAEAYFRAERVLERLVEEALEPERAGSETSS